MEPCLKWNKSTYIQYVNDIIGPIQYFSALHQDAWLFSYMAPVYSSAFAPPTTNKIGAMGAMVPAYFSMTRKEYCFTLDPEDFVRR